MSDELKHLTGAVSCIVCSFLDLMDNEAKHLLDKDSLYIDTERQNRKESMQRSYDLALKVQDELSKIIWPKEE